MVRPRGTNINIAAAGGKKKKRPQTGALFASQFDALWCALQRYRLLTGESPVVVIAREPRSPAPGASERSGVSKRGLDETAVRNLK